MNEDTVHYHVTANGRMQGMPFTSTSQCEADDILREERDTRIIGVVSEIVTCDRSDCGDYLDLLAFERYAAMISSDPVTLDREYQQMVIEGDGHGPI